MIDIYNYKDKWNYKKYGKISISNENLRKFNRIRIITYIFNFTATIIILLIILLGVF